MPFTNTSGQELGNSAGDVVSSGAKACYIDYVPVKDGEAIKAGYGVSVTNGEMIIYNGTKLHGIAVAGTTHKGTCTTPVNPEICRLGYVWVVCDTAVVAPKYGKEAGVRADGKWEEKADGAGTAYFTGLKGNKDSDGNPVFQIILGAI